MPIRNIMLRRKDLIALMEESKIVKSSFNGVEVVDICLTEVMHHAAAFYGLGVRAVNNAAREKGNGSREVYGGNAEVEVASKEGELAASIYLMGETWTAARQWRMGEADSGDLIIWKEHQSNTIDVKMRTKPYHCCFKLTLDQWRSHYPDYYVSTHYPTADRETIRIEGYIERTKIDALVLEETNRLLGLPLRLTYEGSGNEKRVKMTYPELDNLKRSLKNSPQIDKLVAENEVAEGGIGCFEWGPEIIIPFTELRPIGELKSTLRP
jgi:hypothetical protein